MTGDACDSGYNGAKQFHADIVLLWLALLGTVAAFWIARPIAGALLLPYLFWITFASALNFAIWRLNR